MVKAVGSGPAEPTTSLIYVLRPPAVSCAGQEDHIPGLLARQLGKLVRSRNAWS